MKFLSKFFLGVLLLTVFSAATEAPIAAADFDLVVGNALGLSLIRPFIDNNNSAVLQTEPNESYTVESLLNKLTKQANKGQNKPKPENNIGEKLYTNAQEALRLKGKRPP